VGSRLTRVDSCRALAGPPEPRGVMVEETKAAWAGRARV